MKAVFSLTPSESKRLIAKSVVKMDEVKRALDSAYVVLGGGTTNGFIAQELLGRPIEPQRFTAGISTNGILCVTPPEKRHPFPIVLHRGQEVARTIKEVFEDFHVATVFIKGGNAIDPDRNVGIITSGFDGGTVAASIGTMTSTGMQYIFPIGLEKLVPSVKDAVVCTGAKTFDYSIGANFGMYMLVKGLVVTEIDALRVLADVDARQVAAGGVGGSEGSVALVVQGDESSVEKAVDLVRSIKGEPAVPGLKGVCAECRYDCVYKGLAEEELPGRRGQL